MSSIAIILSAKGGDYLTRHRLIRLKELLRAKIVILNLSGVSYAPYTVLGPHRVLASKKSLSIRLRQYQTIIYEDCAAWNSFAISAFSDHPNAYLFSASVEIPQRSNVILSHSTCRDQDHFSIQGYIPILRHAFANKCLYPYHPVDPTKLKWYHDLSGLFMSHPLSFVQTPEKLIQLKRAFKQELLGVQYENRNFYDPEHLNRARYCFLESPVPEGYLADMIQCGMIPILLDWVSPYLCVDQFNALTSGLTGLHRLSKKLSALKDVPADIRQNFITEVTKPFDPNHLLEWVRS